jgi:hypothetical protein
MEAGMSGGDVKQGAFTWSTEAARQAVGREAAGAVPEAPPAAHSGGAQGRSRARMTRAQPDRSSVQLPADDELWDVRAAARFLKRSVSWVYHRAEDGTLPVRRLAGWGIRFIPGELRAWVESGDASHRR